MKNSLRISGATAAAEEIAAISASVCGVFAVFVAWRTYVAMKRL